MAQLQPPVQTIGIREQSGRVVEMEKAGARGGALEGRPRQSRISWVASGNPNRLIHTSEYPIFGFRVIVVTNHDQHTERAIGAKPVTFV